MARRAAPVSGGSSEVGKAMARVLGQEGYALTISGRSAEGTPGRRDARLTGVRNRHGHGPS